MKDAFVTLCMPRLPRIVIPDLPHHVTQRGNRRQDTFFCKEDYETYLHVMGQACRIFGVDIWSYCLMPNHIHMIVVPGCVEALAKAIGQGHEAYTRYINFKMKWRGHLWQGRFSSFPMDERHMILAARYIELNPVAAKMVIHPASYPWSSARAHLGMASSEILNTQALLDRMPAWNEFLLKGITEIAIKMLEKHQRTGRPLGSKKFLRDLEKLTGLSLVPQKPGPKPKKQKTN